MVHSSPQKSTRQQLVKVSQVPYLYRHSLNHRYYGIKKQGGKRKEHALGTTDRKLAERRLKTWLESLSKVNTALEFKFAYGTQNDWVSIPSTAGIDLNAMNGGSGSSTGDEGRLATIVKAKYSGADSHTIFLILIQQFKSTLDPEGNTDQDQGEAITPGLNAYVGDVDAPAVNCSFVARLGIGADSSTTCVPPHELGHQLSCPTADYVNNNNHYNGPQAYENLMINGALDPTPGAVNAAKRLWDDLGHSYPNIPITDQIDFMRSSPFLQ